MPLKGEELDWLKGMQKVSKMSGVCFCVTPSQVITQPPKGSTSSEPRYVNAFLVGM
jgi:hypothetical protein